MEIKNTSGKVLFTIDGNDLRDIDLQNRNLREVSFRDKNLRWSNFYCANLEGADLQEANLEYVNLQGANLQGANLQYANLHGAILQGVNLRYADLQYASLLNADLRYANLLGANLQNAILFGADLQESDLNGVELHYADLRMTNLQDATNIPKYVIATTSIVPEGELIVYKKCQGGKIVTLLIPKDAKRSNATGRKCRFSKAVVLDISEGDTAISLHDENFVYRKGDVLEVTDFCEDRWQECAAGIHAFLTRYEAENYKEF